MVEGAPLDLSGTPRTRGTSTGKCRRRRMGESSFESKARRARAASIRSGWLRVVAPGAVTSVPAFIMIGPASSRRLAKGPRRARWRIAARVMVRTELPFCPPFTHPGFRFNEPNPQPSSEEDNFAQESFSRTCSRASRALSPSLRVKRKRRLLFAGASCSSRDAFDSPGLRTPLVRGGAGGPCDRERHPDRPGDSSPSASSHRP